MTGTNRWEEDGRARKIARYVAGFNLGITGSPRKDPSPAEAIEALRQIDAAGEEQWKKLAEQMGEKRVASPTTRAGIRAHYATIANSPHLAGNADAQEPGRERYEVSGDVAGRPYRVTVQNDGGRGFDWSLYTGATFLRSGYTRGVDVLRAFADARAVFLISISNPAAEAQGGAL